MTFKASKNANGDLLVVVDETVCVSVPVEVHTKTKGMEDARDKDWFDNWLVPRIESSIEPREEVAIGPLSAVAVKQLKALL